MKAVAIKSLKNLEVVEIPTPRVKNGSVVVEVKKAGICGSDIHYWDMGLPENLVMGHEFCGIVTNPGSRTDLKIGDRVTALPISPCGKCPACKSNNHQYCPHTWDEAVGLSLTNPGAYAEMTTVRPDLVVKVPSNITDAEVAMVEPTAVALHAVNLVDIKVGSKVLVIGAGIIGDLCALFAKMNGASYVAISETNVKRGKKAVSLKCADEYFNAKDKNFMVDVKRECPYGYDVVIDCSGNSGAVTSALLCVKPNGSVVLVGVSTSNISIPSSFIVMKELKVFGAIGYTYDEFVNCIKLMADRQIDTLKFVDDIVGLHDVQNAFERLTSGDDNAIKILIDPKK
ncbi:MAG: zinc-binding dehydrogenase [Candidatus Coprovivens sp.]